MRALVSLNGVEFEVEAPGHIYDGERLDFNMAVERALGAYRLEYPLDPIDFASLEVCISRVYTERASRDGVGVDSGHVFVEPASEDEADLSDDELDELTAPDPDDD